MTADREHGLAPALQARVLHDALPYVQSVQGKVFVVYCAGGWLADPALRAGLGRDVALLHLVGLRLVLVHGGSIGTPTDATPTRRDLVGIINQQGCRAVGLTCEDGGNSRLANGLIQRLHAQGFIPVVISDPRGGHAPAAAGALAADLAQRLCAEKLLLQGDSPGLFDRDGRLVATLSARDVPRWLDGAALAPAIRAGLDLSLDAVAHGVRSAHFVDGRTEHALLLELLSNAGAGTTVLPEQAPHFLDDSRRYLGRH